MPAVDVVSSIAPTIWSCPTGDGKVELHRLAWDSTLLGLSVGSVDVTAGCSPDGGRAPAALADAIRRARLQLVRARVADVDVAILRYLRSAGFNQVGALLSEVLTLDRSRGSEGTGVRPATTEDTAVVRELAEAGYHNLLLDIPGIDRSRVRGLYAAWAENDVLGRVSDVLLAGRSGFVAFDRGGPDAPAFIDLVVVDPRVRRQGVGAALMHAALGTASASGAKEMTLGVSEGNSRAVALYRRFGFVDVGRSLELLWSSALA